MIKNLPAMWETWVHPLGWEDPLEEGMAALSSVLAWRMSMDRERSLAGWSSWGCKELDMTEQLSTHTKCQCILMILMYHSDADIQV